LLEEKSGVLSLLILTVVILTIMTILFVALRDYFPSNIVEFLEQLGKREDSDRFDN
jgi:hypothetical protein